MRVNVLPPLWFARHGSVRDSLLGLHVGGRGVQASETLNHPLSTADPPMQLLSRFQVSAPEKLTGHARCSVIAE